MGESDRGQLFGIKKSLSCLFHQTNESRGASPLRSHDPGQRMINNSCSLLANFTAVELFERRLQEFLRIAGKEQH